MHRVVGLAVKKGGMCTNDLALQVRASRLDSEDALA